MDLKQNIERVQLMDADNNVAQTMESAQNSPPSSEAGRDILNSPCNKNRMGANGRKRSSAEDTLLASERE